MRNLFPVSTDFAFPDSTFDNFFNGLFQPTAETQVKLPKVDIEDTGKAYVLTADLPGMAKKISPLPMPTTSWLSEHSIRKKQKKNLPKPVLRLLLPAVIQLKRAARLRQKKNIISSVKNVPIRYIAVSSSSVTSSAMASKLRLKTVSSPSRYPNRILMPFRPASGLISNK